MTLEEAIKQLECLREHCKDFQSEKNDIWSKDVKAINMAIKANTTTD